jgi:hypothetical protein
MYVVVKTTSVPLAAMPPTFFCPVASVTTVLSPPLLEPPLDPLLEPVPDPLLEPPLDPPAAASPPLDPPSGPPPALDEHAAANSRGTHAPTMAKDGILILYSGSERAAGRSPSGTDTTDHFDGAAVFALDAFARSGIRCASVGENAVTSEGVLLGWLDDAQAPMASGTSTDA